MVSAHFCAAVPNFRIMEIEVDDVPWKDELVTHVPVIENGELVLADRPGRGTEVNEKVMKKHAPVNCSPRRRITSGNPLQRPLHVLAHVGIRIGAMLLEVAATGRVGDLA
jgi:hypothetical protein